MNASLAPEAFITGNKKAAGTFLGGFFMIYVQNY